mmetsp:Transcript_54534/g.158425  ORF Transcript_54534/g.158425 Transcript_54534/m.158425 type:complete len:227 (+) Transcript_54534:2116-2796(+)
MGLDLPAPANSRRGAMPNSLCTWLMAATPRATRLVDHHAENDDNHARKPVPKSAAEASREGLFAALGIAAGGTTAKLLASALQGAGCLGTMFGEASAAAAPSPNSGGEPPSSITCRARPQTIMEMRPSPPRSSGGSAFRPCFHRMFTSRPKENRVPLACGKYNNVRPSTWRNANSRSRPKEIPIVMFCVSALLGLKAALSWWKGFQSMPSRYQLKRVAMDSRSRSK